MRTRFAPYPAESPTNNAISWQSAIILAACLIAVVVLLGCEKKEEKPKPGPPEVLVAEVVQQNVPISNEWVAQLNGPVNADITPKVQGYLLQAELPERLLRQEGPASVRARSAAIPGRAGAGQGQSSGVASQATTSTLPMCNATLRWQRKTRSRRSSSIPISPIRRP